MNMGQKLCNAILLFSFAINLLCVQLFILTMAEGYGRTIDLFRKIEESAFIKAKR